MPRRHKARELVSWRAVVKGADAFFVDSSFYKCHAFLFIQSSDRKKRRKEETSEKNEKELSEKDQYEVIVDLIASLLARFPWESLG